MPQFDVVIVNLADKWLAEAREHEAAMREIDKENGGNPSQERLEEWFLHREKAETLRKCAFDLR